jgi:hypothetical protein
MEHRTVMVVLTTVSPTCPMAWPLCGFGITEKLVSDFFEDFTYQIVRIYRFRVSRNFVISLFRDFVNLQFRGSANPWFRNSTIS